MAAAADATAATTHRAPPPHAATAVKTTTASLCAALHAAQMNNARSRDLLKEIKNRCVSQTGDFTASFSWRRSLLPPQPTAQRRDAARTPTPPQAAQIRRCRWPHRARVAAATAQRRTRRPQRRSFARRTLARRPAAPTAAPSAACAAAPAVASSHGPACDSFAPAAAATRRAQRQRANRATRLRRDPARPLRRPLASNQSARFAALVEQSSGASKDRCAPSAASDGCRMDSL